VSCVDFTGTRSLTFNEFCSAFLRLALVSRYQQIQLKTHLSKRSSKSTVEIRSFTELAAETVARERVTKSRRSVLRILREVTLGNGATSGTLSKKLTSLTNNRDDPGFYSAKALARSLRLFCASVSDKLMLSGKDVVQLQKKEKLLRRKTRPPEHIK
jgi:hypothetical protein